MSSDYFTGAVWQDPIIEAPEPARLRALKVTFDPRAKTTWHSHPFGQTLYILSGVGLSDDEMKLQKLFPRGILFGSHQMTSIGTAPRQQIRCVMWQFKKAAKEALHIGANTF